MFSIDFINEVTLFDVKAFNYCNNNCPSCPLSKRERVVAEKISRIDFDKIISLSEEYRAKFEKKTIHFQIGVGNTLGEFEDLFWFISRIVDSSRGKTIIEIATTLIEKEDRDKISRLCKIIPDNIEFIIETVIDPHTEKSLIPIIKDNFSFIKSMNLPHHVLVRYSNSLFVNSDYFIETMNAINSYFRLDFLYNNKFINRFTLDNYLNLFELIKKKIPLLIYEGDFLAIDRLVKNPISGFSFGNNLSVELLSTTPFGDILINEPTLLLNKSGHFSASDFLLLEVHHAKELIRNKIKNKICMSCDYKDSCPSSIINSVSIANGIKYTADNCLGGAKYMK